MARTAFRWFWSAICQYTRTSNTRRPRSERRTAWRIWPRLPLRLERLEDLALPSATVFTDHADYGPGQTALITASGFQVGETVRLNVDITAPPPGLSFDPWFVTDGGPGDLDGVADGSIQTSWLVDGQAAGATLVLTATGQASGLTAQSSFTDSQPPSNLTLTAAPGTVNEGGTVGVNGSFTDPDAADPHSLTVTWGDGTTDTVNLTGGAAGSPRGFYPFDSTANDASGNGANGALSPNPPTFTTGGFEGGAVQFSAADNNFVTVPVNINPSAAPQLTMGGWFRATNASAVVRGLISQDDGGFDRTLDIDTRTDGTARWSAFTGSGVLGGPQVVPNAWTFVVVRYDQTAGTVSLTVDGATTTVTGQFEGPSIETATTVGRNPHFDAPFDGQADDVFFYNAFLSDAQVAAIRAGSSAAVLGQRTFFLTHQYRDNLPGNGPYGITA
ncbi:MAG TPA: LamG-like jellyroll fold domain-containing protein, partial [Gemmataceae bacterium]